MRTIGVFEVAEGAAHNFEFRYALRYVAAGFRTAFLPGVHCVHMAANLYARRPERAAALDAMFARHGLNSVRGIVQPSSVYKVWRRQCMDCAPAPPPQDEP